MPTFEEICQKVFADKEFGNKILIGGLISFVPLFPVLNLFTLGYMRRYMLHIRDSGNVGLPEFKNWWKHLGSLFLEGVLPLLILLIYSTISWFIGYLLMFVLTPLFKVLFVDFLLISLPFVFACLFAPLLSLATLYLYQKRRRYEDMLRLDLLWGLIRASWRHLVLPGLVFTGLMLVGAPLYGFAFFLGFGLLTAYSTVVFLIIEERGEAGLQFE